MFGSFGAKAQDLDLLWQILTPEDRSIVDRLAADFYQESLRQVQADAIEDRTSAIYASAAETERMQFRAERRSRWSEMSEATRNELRNAKRPEYENLTDDQKAPFREHALRRLGGAGAIDERALAEAFSRDI